MFYGDVLTHTISGAHWKVINENFPEVSIARRTSVSVIEVAQRRLSPFDDHEIMAGAGTTGLEMAEQLAAAGEEPDAVIVNCNGGGLASGVIEALTHSFPAMEKYIVEPAGYDKMAKSLAAREVRSNPAVRNTIMDGISGPIAGKRPLEVLLRHGVNALTVEDNQAMQAVAAAFFTLKTVIEPGGAASLAAVQGQNCGHRCVGRKR